MTTLWVLGAELTSPDADGLLGSVLGAMTNPRVLLAPWDRPVSSNPATVACLATDCDWGIAMSDGASCRWRTDAGHTLVTVASTENVELPLAMTPVTVDKTQSHAYRMFPPYVANTPLAGGITEITYQAGDDLYARLTIPNAVEGDE